MAAITITTASVPENYCPGTIQKTWPFLVSLLAGQLEGNLTTFNFGPDTPSPDNQDKPWFKTDATYLPERWYTFSNGSWVSLHPVAPGAIMMYTGTEASITTYDGGEAGVVTATQGPMWEKVSALDARFPMGAGTLPISGTAVPVTGTGGEERHTLTRGELPDVQIDTPLRRRVDLQDGGGSTALYETSFGGGVSVDVPTEDLGDGESHQNLPPYYAVFFIRRTARTHYRI